MSYFETLVEAGSLLDELCSEHSRWSQATFGTDQERGPIGPLKHLAKEAQEAQNSPNDPLEYADCLLLVLDASRRAGIKPIELMKYALQKLEINKNRKWNVAAGNDEAVEHIED